MKLEDCFKKSPDKTVLIIITICVKVGTDYNIFT